MIKLKEDIKPRIPLEWILGLSAAISLYAAGLAAIDFVATNNKKIVINNYTLHYKADFPFGYTHLSEFKGDPEVLVEKFRFGKHTRTWWDYPDTKYLDAFYDGERWYNPGEDDAVLAKEKKNLEKELERFK